MKYLLKRCGHQELGSMDASMKPQRGQYLLMSLQNDVLSFFPPLSTSQKNDFRMVALYPLYCEGKVYCRFVYHNDKFHGSTAVHPRNEYRLYLNREVQGGCTLFHENGIVALRLVDEANFESGLYVDYVAPGSASYATYDAIMKTNALGSSDNYAVYCGEIKDFENRVLKVDTNTSDVKVAKEDVDFIAKSSNDIASLFNEKQFRDFVSVAYQHKCAITGTVIAYESMNNLETAHIQPKSHGGPFLPSNGLSLCRDFHWAFDHGFLALTDDCHVMVSKKAPSDLLMPYDGKEIFMPEEPFFRPKVEFIQYHRKNVFEHFEQIRSLDK